MKRKLIILVGSLALVMLVAAVVFPFAWPANWYVLSYWHTQPVTNAIPYIATMNGITAAAQNAIVPPTNFTYGDRLWGVIDIDSVVGAGGGLTYFETVPLDSVRWNATHDSIYCGVEIGPRSIWIWDDVDGL